MCFWNGFVAYDRPWCPWWNKERRTSMSPNCTQPVKDASPCTYSTGSFICVFISFCAVHGAYCVILKIAWNKSFFFLLLFVLFACVGVQWHATAPTRLQRYSTWFCNSNTEAFWGLNLRRSTGAVGYRGEAGKPTEYLIRNKHISCEQLSVDLAIFLRASAHVLTQTGLGSILPRRTLLSASTWVLN